MTSPESVWAALAAVIDPELRRPITDIGMVGDIEVSAGAATVHIKLTIAGCPKKDHILSDVRAAVLAVPGVESAQIHMGVMTDEERTALTDMIHGGRSPEDRFGPDSLTRVIAVTSGKGGVGKSTLSTNLAVGLAQRGLRVGLLDADVFGFSVPALLGIDGVKPTPVGAMILPPEAYGVSVISIGMFVDPHTPVSWRGPMLHRTVRQFLADVHYGDIDVLVCDLPPGTGDVAISLGQMVPGADVVVVTTPQRAASDVAERSALVARQMGQRVIGVVENMSGFVDENGTTHNIFGTGGGLDVAERLDVPLFAQVPLSEALRTSGDEGRPLISRAESDAASVALNELVDRVIETQRPRGNRSLPLNV
jgi:ATP-binding protein involved in chromosome partitioning